MGIDYIISPPEWLCKSCNIKNKGVICDNCKKWYNSANRDCILL